MLDRALQPQILDFLRTRYPRRAMPVRELGLNEEQAAANLVYLEEHGLCESGVSFGADGFLSFYDARITAAGLDFLEDGGGLSAILGVVTVRLHADTIKSLIGAKIEASLIPAEEKSRLRTALAELPAAGLKGVITELVKGGLDHLPDGVHWPRPLVGL